MDDMIINGLAILAGFIVARIIFVKFSKGSKQKDDFREEYAKVLHNSEYKVKGNL